ncbi:histone deacetylase [Candidatus Aerophobetes bacterium]|nr:histone deacetylase [Deltaproteobacteria bacterium]MCD6318282.1 histone deacetylase [Candidatus Aerophobetes bacterium]RLA89572.1 MAG: histone deacetylase [Deltaproteobacteria bacterium]
MIGIVRDIRYLAHETGPLHVENPQRLRAVYEMLEKEEIKHLYTLIPARAASIEEVEMVHSPIHIDRILKTAGLPRRIFAPDTVTSPKSYEAAFLAVGGVLEAISFVMKRKNFPAFALVRPPGHHAERNKAMGFCFFNNIAVGAKFAKEKLGLERILIVDWDVHHGNGTQHTFYKDPSILYFSIHQFPFFPGTGDFYEKGEGPGEGFTINVPISRNKDDADYGCLFRHLLLPVIDEFSPQLILISAGFDTHIEDPLGGMKMTEPGFARLTKLLYDKAKKICEGRMVLVLEGGYYPRGVRESVKAILYELDNQTICDHQKMEEKENKAFQKMNLVINQVREIHKNYWKSYNHITRMHYSLKPMHDPTL